MCVPFRPYVYLTQTDLWFSPILRLVDTIKASTETGMEQALLKELSCPISFQLMTDPVSAEDGHTYEQAAIQEWIDKCRAGKLLITNGQIWRDAKVLNMWEADKGTIAALIDECGADKRELTSPLTGAPMGTGLRPNLLARSLVRNVVRSNIHGT
jgi:hypothetical protein